MAPEDRLKELGIDLPEVSEPVAAYKPYKRVGNLVFVSGQLPFDDDGNLTHEGKVGDGLSVKEGQEAARRAAVNAIAALQAAANGRLDLVTQIVRVEGHVASAEGFTDQPQVVNGASDLLGDVFGRAGEHARVALGANELPLGTPVEVALIAEVRNAETDRHDIDEDIDVQGA